MLVLLSDPNDFRLPELRFVFGEGEAGVDARRLIDPPSPQLSTP